MVKEKIAHEHCRIEKCSMCCREIKVGEKYYRTGREGYKSCRRSLRPSMKRFGVRIYCSDCIDKIYVDA
jgi:hypothetical protein